jgi:uncharacterized protein YdeI (YjbR/CyaY-like superfamily)
MTNQRTLIAKWPTVTASMKPIFFKTPAAFRAWLARNHAKAAELLVGFYKKDSGKPSITWPESVDQALCFGWIDGVRKSVDDVSYTIRFSPRRAGSIWSGVNIKRAEALIEQGLMQPAGLEAFRARKEYKSGVYSYEQRSVDLPEEYARLVKKNAAAWRYLQAESAYYRKAIFWWIVCAKKEETRLKRVDQLVSYSAKGERIPGFKPTKSGG